MKGKRKKQSGFTLIEVLMVVVIIGILASLIVPRFSSAPEKAIVAEANQMLGAMIRAQIANVDGGGNFSALLDTDATSDTKWGRLGMKAPGAAVASGTGPKFTYTCTSPSCTATRKDQPAKTLNITLAGVWTCGADYTPMINGGCTLS